MLGAVQLKSGEIGEWRVDFGVEMAEGPEMGMKGVSDYVSERLC